MKGTHSILLIYLRWLKCVRSLAADRVAAMPALLLAWVALLWLTFATATTQAQTLLSETTWGGAGGDVAEGVASAADGSSYVVGITDSFTTDQFGNPSPKIFVVKFAPDGALSWQRIWNGTTIRGLGRPDVAISTDGSVYVTGVTADNQNDAVLLKFDANGNLVWERAWGGAASDEGLAVATASDGSVYIAGTAESFGSSTGLFGGARENCAITCRLGSASRRAKTLNSTAAELRAYYPTSKAPSSPVLGLKLH